MTDTRESEVATGGWIRSAPEQFQANLNRKSFEFSHDLATHPLLQLPQLMGLAERTLNTRPDLLHYDVGNIRVDQRWDQIAASNLSAEEALQRVENCGAWFIFKSAQHDHKYQVFLDRGLAELKAQMERGIDSKIMVEDIIIFVTSPNRVTTYHIDRECNFLLQIQGTKTLYVFDREDREVLSEEEIERFWAIDFNAAVYKSQFQNRATTYKLVPGMGVHIPVNCPHWLQNDDNVSISLSVNFQFKDTLRANAYRANFLLRKLGFHPTPPGRSTILDHAKSYAVVPLIWAKTPVKRIVQSAKHLPRGFRKEQISKG